MKAQRLLLAISVIGAVAVGGAVTGTTLARWQDHATMSATSVTSGAFAFTVNGQTQTLNLGSWSTSANTETRAFPLTIRNDGTGKNLRMVTSVTGVTKTNPSGVPLTLRFGMVNAPGQCTVGASGLAEFTTQPIALTPQLAPGATGHGCLVATVERTSPPATAQNASVTITIQGKQVRP